MLNFKLLRDRIISVKSTKKITQAMYIVASSKLKKIKDKAEEIDYYSHNLIDIINNIIKNYDLTKLSKNDYKFFNDKLEDDINLLVVMSSDKGLCGNFNSNIIKSVKEDIIKFKKNQQKVKLLIIGKKAIDFF